MPYELIREARGVHKRFWGTVTPQEFLSTVRDLHNDPDFRSYRYSINDFTDVERFSMSEDELVQAAAIHVGSTFSNERFRVIGISTNPAWIDLAKRYDETTGISRLIVFSTLAEARAWIAQNC